MSCILNSKYSQLEALAASSLRSDCCLPDPVDLVLTLCARLLQVQGSAFDTALAVILFKC